MRTGQASKQAPHSVDAYGSDGVVLDPGQLRREHRADRARVDRAVGVPAGALVDRADVQAGAAPDAVQRRRGRPRRPAPPCGRCRAARGGTSCGPSPGVTPVHIEVYGFIRSPVDERGSSCRNTSRSRQVGTSFSMPMTVISVSRQGQAHPAVALGLDHDQRAGLGDREVGAGDRRPARQELARRRCARAAIGQRGAGSSVSVGVDAAASRAGRSRGSRPGCGGSPAPGCATACRARAGRSARRGRSPRRRCPAASSASLSPISWVAIDLTLTTSVGAGRPDQVGDDRVGLVGVAGPVHGAAARGDLLLQLHQVARRGGPCVARLDRLAGRPQLLPVRHLGDDRGALGADRARWRGRGCAAAGCRPARSGRRPGTARRRAGAPTPARRGHAACPRKRRLIGRLPRVGRGEDLGQVHGPGAGAQPGQPAADVHQAGRVAGRARPRRRWRARGASCRRASPSRCRRSSARTCRRTRSTGRRRAARPGRCRATARSSRSGLSPTRSIRSEWQVGW